MRSDCREPKDGGEYHQAGADARFSGRGSFQLGANEHVVGRVRKEYRQRGLAVLEDRARPGRPRSSRDEQSVQKVVETVCQAPAKGLSRWSARTLAGHLDIPSATVNRILRENKLQPHRLRTFTFSPDPQFGEKLLEVVALYMNPPDNAVVLCMDEKTGIQALDRTQPMLPLRATKPRSWTNEYVRHGTRTLVFRSGAREASSLMRKTSIHRSSAVCAIGRSPSGISERSPRAVRLWRKRSH